jgi:hypothetical protein
MPEVSSRASTVARQTAAWAWLQRGELQGASAAIVARFGRDGRARRGYNGLMASKHRDEIGSWLDAQRARIVSIEVQEAATKAHAEKRQVTRAAAEAAIIAARATVTEWVAFLVARGVKVHLGRGTTRLSLSVMRGASTCSVAIELEDEGGASVRREGWRDNQGDSFSAATLTQAQVEAEVFACIEAATK